MTHKMSTTQHKHDPCQGLPPYIKGWLHSGGEKGTQIPVTTVLMQLCGDSFPEAAILGQILYWHGRKSNGETRLRIFKYGHWWVAKQHSDWYHEVRVKETTAKRAIAGLKKRGLIHVEYHRFGGIKQCFIRPLWENLEVGLQAAYEADNLVRSKWPDRRGQNDLTGEVKMTRPLTETTNRDYPTEITDPEHNADREKPEQTYYYVDTMCGGDENFSVVGNHQQNEDHTSPTYSQTLAIAPNNVYLVTNPTNEDKVSRGFSLSREKSSPTPLDELLNQEYYLGYNNIPCDGPYRLIGPLTAQRMQWVIFHRSDAFTLLRGHDGELYVRSDFDGVLHGSEAIAKYKLKKLFQLADDSNPRHEKMALDPHWYNEEMQTAFMFFREYVKTHNITSDFSVGQLLLEMGEIEAESMTKEDYEELMSF